MRYKYCPDCGTKLIPKHAGDDGAVPYCESCKEFRFDTFHSCVIVLTYNEFDEIILCRQGLSFRPLYERDVRLYISR